MFLLSRFSVVVAPCLAITLVDSNCLSALWITPSEITSTYEYNICSSFNITSKACLEESVLTSENTFVPPFIYSYQCSSSLLVQYVPMFMAMYGVSGIVIPFGQYLMLRYLGSRYGKGSDVVDDESSAVVPESAEVTSVEGDSSTTPHQNDPVVSSLNERLLLASSQENNRAPSIRAVQLLTLGSVMPLHWPWRVLVDQGFVPSTDDMKVEEGCEEDGDGLVGSQAHSMSKWNLPTRYRIQSVTCNVIASLGVLLTFGLGYPHLPW